LEEEKEIAAEQEQDDQQKCHEKAGYCGEKKYQRKKNATQ